MLSSAVATVVRILSWNLSEVVLSVHSSEIENVISSMTDHRTLALFSSAGRLGM